MSSELSRPDVLPAPLKRRMDRLGLRAELELFEQRIKGVKAEASLHTAANTAEVALEHIDRLSHQSLLGTMRLTQHATDLTRQTGIVPPEVGKLIRDNVAQKQRVISAYTDRVAGRERDPAVELGKLLYPNGAGNVIDFSDPPRLNP